MTALNRHAILAVAGLAVLFGCAPQRPYRTPLPAPSAPQIVHMPPPTPEPEPARRPLPQEGKIFEQELKRAPAVSGAARDSAREPGALPSEPLAPPLPDNSSLLAKITAGTLPQRAASLRLTEEGRKLLDAGDAPKALTRLEKAIVIDSTNSYGYFYMAKAQHRLGRYKESLNFLDVAEARLGDDPFWRSEVFALRGENFRALGMIDKAQSSYAQALRLNSGNRTAADALSRPVPSETSFSPR